MREVLITKRQKELLRIVYNYIKGSGFPPSFSDLKEELNVSSNQSVLDLLSALERKGFIKREGGSARAIKILKKGFEALGVKQLVPVVGTMAAGSFVEAIEEIGSWKELSQEVSQLSDDLMMLKVSGDSMINAGINDGDLILVKRTNYFKSGDIVLARNHDGATLKRIVLEKGKYFLKPENPNYSIILFTDETEIIGKMIKKI